MQNKLSDTVTEQGYMGSPDLKKDVEMDKVQIGFIGAGTFISAHHLLTVRDSKIMEIRAIADLDKDILRKHAAAVDISYTTTDYNKLLNDPDVHIVIIGTKQNLHSQLIVECLDAGKWVLCEKPMSETREETEAVLAAEKRNPGRLAIGFNRRFAPAYANAKRLMQQVKRPWYVNYRLMFPSPGKQKSFYAKQPRILYEGCHILDLACWLLDAAPNRVFMTGDKYSNNCCILEYPDGSQVSFMCGSIGSYCLWKEYVEIFGRWTAITVNDFVDMRVRGFEGEFDRVYPPQLDEHAEEIHKWGFNFYDAYRVDQLAKERARQKIEDGIDIIPVRRPTPVQFDPSQYGPVHPDLYAFIPDKGWIESVEHFARCFLEGTDPKNADATAGALSTNVALALLESLRIGQPVEMSHQNPA